jgi:DNA-directed RNA polymerase specialized sigma24 family protein
MPVAQIAAVLELSQNAVDVRLHRARARLRLELRPHVEAVDVF